MVRLTVLNCCSFLFLAFAGTIQPADAQNAGNLSIVPIVQASALTKSAPAPKMPVFGDTGCAADVAQCGQAGGFFSDRSNGPMASRIRDMFPKIDISMARTCGCEGVCQCDKRRYRSFFIGGNQLDMFVDSNNTVSGDYRDGFILGTARGQYVNENTRIELESTWRNNSGDFWTTNAAQTAFDGHMNNFSSMVNLVRDFGSSDRYNFYLGGGTGFSRSKGEMLVDGDQYNVRAWAFAYQAFIGLNFIKRQNADAYLEYRYFGNSNTNMKLNGVIFDTMHYEASNFTFGVRFKR